MRKLSAGLAVAALALSGVTLLSPGVQPAQAAETTAVAPGAYSLTNAATAKNFHVNGVSLAAGTKIVQDTPRGTAGQSWWVAQTAPGIYQLRNNNSGLCLQDAAAAGGVLTQENCADVTTQRWNITAGTGGSTLTNVATGRAAEASSTSGDVVSVAAGAATAQRWTLAKNNITRVTAWGTALTDGGPALNNKTVRMLVRPNLAGNAQRITLSNRFGTAPLVVGAASVAYQGTGLTTSGAPTAYKFGGQASVTIPVGGEVTSDALNVALKTDTNLVVSVFVSGNVPVSTFHNLGNVTTGIGDGNLSAATVASGFTQNSSNFFFLKGIDVISATAKGSMVALGDSITDGYGATTNGFNNWPAQLAGKINGRDQSIAMVNAGISSNRVTFEAGAAKNRGMAATTRFAYDVAAVPGVTSVFLFEGINDIPDGADSNRLIAGYRNIIAQARARGLKIYGATMTPTKGTSSFTAARELVRTTTNNWIMTSGEFDGVVDFSAAVADPADAQRILAKYDSGDHIHLSPAGYGALASAADVAPITQAFAPTLSGPAQAVTAGGAGPFLGEGFAPNEVISITGDCLDAGVTATANSAGIFTAAVTFAQACPAGSVIVTALGAVSKVSASASVTVTAAPSPTPSATVTATPTASATPTVTPTVTATPSATVTPTASASATVAATPSTTVTATPTASDTATATLSAPASPTASAVTGAAMGTLGSATVAPGGELTITGNNFKPGTNASFMLFSEPVLLGSATVAADGSVTLKAVVPSDTPAGAHTVVITGTSAAGDPIEVRLALEVAADSGLANTGSNGIVVGAVASMLLLCGGLLFTAARRRSANH